MTTMEWITAAGVVVQVLLLGGLIWYCFETRGIRITSQAQLEALHTPCMTFKATPRNEADAILEMHDARGAMILDFIEGSAVLLNIGTGPAVNVSYVFTSLDEANIRRLDGYIPFVPPKVICSIPVSRTSLVNSDYTCLIEYESLSQAHYSTMMTIRNLVLTPPFTFDTLQKQPKSVT
jgi:hypothetical protein